MRTMVGAVAAALAIGVVGAAPVEAAPCTYTYNEYGYPQWSDTCGTGMAPGRIGPLRMGVTTVARARSLGYLARNRACGDRLDGVGLEEDEGAFHVRIGFGLDSRLGWQ